MDAIITQQLLCYCDGCHGQVQALLHCSTCLRNFCKNCGAEHQKIRTRTGTHEIVALWQAKRFRRTNVCLDHPQHSLKFYCIACQQVTCCECMWRESHRGHACENHKTAGRTAARILANAVKDARILLNSLLVNYTPKSFSAANLYRKRCSFLNETTNLQENEKEYLHAQEAKQRIEEFRRLETSRHLLDAISLAEQLLAEGLEAEILYLSKVVCIEEKTTREYFIAVHFVRAEEKRKLSVSVRELCLVDIEDADTLILDILELNIGLVADLQIVTVAARNGKFKIHLICLFN
ncbi:hypothetical protein G9C98_007615 [Cotesia typhae]|uniref:B box-type domain-containing protein n=1 Tax=Cotesia typhae TaxID=2053667 RepID=A0A8J5R923_9HYME|nr:hypothetical protein G9C98_007615 [Cotesia typhae]